MQSRAMHRVLMAAPFYYPSAAVGAHRAGKFARFLPESGWWPTVLTVREDLYSLLHPQVDDELKGQIPADVEVLRTGLPFTKWSSGLMQWLRSRRRRDTTASASNGGPSRERRVSLKSWIDTPETIEWLPFGVAAGLRAARRCDVIWATSPPAGALCLAAVLSRLGRKPLVVDFRDPWRLEEVKPLPTPIHCWMDKRWERFVLQTASRIVVVTPVMAELLGRKYPEYSGKIALIYNGYDSADFSPQRDSPTTDAGAILRIGYFGAVYQGREEYMLKLLEAIGLISRGSEGTRFRLVVRGPTSPQIHELAIRAKALDMVDNGGSVPYRRALEMMTEMDVLLLTGSRQHGYALPGKLFEYMGAGRPILAMTPPGALSDFVRRYQVGVAVDPADGAGAVAVLRDLPADLPLYRSKLRQVSGQFTREACTRQLAQILDETLACGSAEESALRA
jgi:glycosyltransferase involved in cell wall biosynthesis